MDVILLRAWVSLGAILTRGGRSIGSDGEMKLREALKLSIRLVHSRAKLFEASFAPLSHLLDKKHTTGNMITVTIGSVYTF